MKRPLRLLMLEDSDDDAFLLRRELSRGGFELTEVRVESAAGLRDALANHTFDIAITDYSMPSFTGIDALAIIKESGLDLPVIMVSGTLGEDAAVAALQGGAEDFVVKGRLARLIPAMERAMREASERVSRREAEAAAHAAILEKQAAEAANKAKSDFIAHVSHELRTPLNAILGFSEVLAERIDGDLNERQTEHVHNVIASGRHLLSIINDILDVAKVEAGRMELARVPTSVTTIAKQLRSTLAPLLESRSLTLDLAIPADLPLVSADPLRLKQVLYNLLSNAAKFTEPGGKISIKAELVQDRLTIAVSDTGIGIRAEDLPRLFRTFEQIAPSERAKVEGTGLGLALTQQLVALHGGTIAVESEHGRGSTFTITIPDARAGIEAAPSAGSVPPPSTQSVPKGKLRIVVVEDDAASRTLVRVLLDRRGHEILMATTVGEACALLAKHCPDIVLTDLNVEGGGGERVLEEVRSRESGARLPVVAITAHAMGGVRERLLAKGFDGYMSKPIDTRSFATTIESYVHPEAAS